MTKYYEPSDEELADAIRRLAELVRARNEARQVFDEIVRYSATNPHPVYQRMRDAVTFAGSDLTAQIRALLFSVTDFERKEQ